jgi:radical SAM superfamily enzyme YgiQ (UPF0313 family)
VILLIQPPSREQGKLIYPPLGLLAVAALPDSLGIPVRILDANVLGQAEVERVIRTSNPTIVGITSFTGPMLVGALELANYARKHTNAKIVWGGVHASILPEETLANDCVDIVVMFEGDLTFLELLSNLDAPERVAGIMYKQGGKILTNPRRPLIADLGTLPPTPWHLVDTEAYVIPWAQAERTLPIISSRGCPYRCTFCYNLVFNEQSWRPFPVARVQQEIDTLATRHRLDGIRLDASDLFIGPGATGRRHALDIVEHAHGRGLKWAVQVRTNQIDEKLLREFKTLGCNYIFYGIESGSKRVLREIYKDIRLDNIRKVVNLTNELDIKCAAGVMYDFPGETLDEFRETVDLFKETSILVRFSALQPYPGTPIYEYVKQKGLIAFPTDTLGWASFDYNHPHGLSDIPNVKARAGEWNLKYNYGHNLLVTLKRRDWFFLKTMTESFVDYYVQEKKAFFGGKSFELNY